MNPKALASFFFHNPPPLFFFSFSSFPSAGDIKEHLPSEARLFALVNQSWLSIMKRVQLNPRVLAVPTVAGVLEALQLANTHLEHISKSLDDYLETKRLVFPRFCFLVGS